MRQMVLLLAGMASLLMGEHLYEIHVPGDTLNVRTHPSSHSRRIGQLPGNAHNVHLLQYSRNGKWVQVRYEHYGASIMGWVFGKYVRSQHRTFPTDDSLSYSDKKYILKLLSSKKITYDHDIMLKPLLHDILTGGTEYFVSVFRYDCRRKGVMHACELGVETATSETENEEEHGAEITVRMKVRRSNGSLKIISVDHVRVLD
jgi:hypothetical protein